MIPATQYLARYNRIFRAYKTKCFPASFFKWLGHCYARIFPQPVPDKLHSNQPEAFYVFWFQTIRLHECGDIDHPVPKKLHSNPPQAFPLGTAIGDATENIQCFGSKNQTMWFQGCDSKIQENS